MDVGRGIRSVLREVRGIRERKSQKNIDSTKVDMKLGDGGNLGDWKFLDDDKMLRGQPIGAVIGDWLEHFERPEDVRPWVEKARCWLPEAAIAMTKAGITPEQAAQVHEAQVDYGNYTDTVGYKVACGDLSVGDVLDFIKESVQIVGKHESRHVEQAESTNEEIEARWNELVAEAEDTQGSQFMEPELIKTEYWEADTPEGIFFMPTDDFPDEESVREALPDEVWSLERDEGYLARLSASGYMDQTEYTPIRSVDDVDEFFNMYVWMESRRRESKKHSVKENFIQSAIMVQKTGDSYDIPGSAEPEEWTDVKAEVAEVERLDDLKGWGEYTAVYSVTDWDGNKSFYFVAESKTEAKAEGEKEYLFALDFSGTYHVSKRDREVWQRGTSERDARRKLWDSLSDEEQKALSSPKHHNLAVVYVIDERPVAESKQRVAEAATWEVEWYPADSDGLRVERGMTTAEQVQAFIQGENLSDAEDLRVTDPEGNPYSYVSGELMPESRQVNEANTSSGEQPDDARPDFIGGVTDVDGPKDSDWPLNKIEVYVKDARDAFSAAAELRDALRPYSAVRHFDPSYDGENYVLRIEVPRKVATDALAAIESVARKRGIDVRVDGLVAEATAIDRTNKYIEEPESLFGPVVVLSIRGDTDIELDGPDVYVGVVHDASGYTPGAAVHMLQGYGSENTVLQEAFADLEAHIVDNLSDSDREEMERDAADAGMDFFEYVTEGWDGYTATLSPVQLKACVDADLERYAKSRTLEITFVEEAQESRKRLAEGYTHYWEVVDDACFSDEQWFEILVVAREIVASSNVVIRGPFGDGEPVFDSKKIALNGDAEEGEDGETFILLRCPEAFEFCKTGRRPYDEVVVRILRAAKRIAPGVLRLSSDGGAEVFGESEKRRKVEQDDAYGPGGHIPDGTGPHGAGAGPGGGRGDGSGIGDEEANDEFGPEPEPDEEDLSGRTLASEPPELNPGDVVVLDTGEGPVDGTIAEGDDEHPYRKTIALWGELEATAYLVSVADEETGEEFETYVLASLLR